MPWRRRPRAAVCCLLSASALVAAAAGLRAPHDFAGQLLDQTLARDAAGCARVSAGVWHPLSGLEFTGRLRLALPARLGGAITFYIGDSLPLDVEAMRDGDRPVAMLHERLLSGPGVLLPPDFWLDDGSPVEGPRHISRVRVDALADREQAFTLALGRRAPRVLARLINYPANVRVPVCAEPVPAGEVYFATGWSGQESDPREGAVRWMREHGAVLVSSLEGRAARVTVRVAPAAGDSAEAVTELRVRVNDIYDLPPVLLANRFADYELVVPDPAWTRGTNELLLSVSRTRTIGTRVRGLALASLHVR